MAVEIAACTHKRSQSQLKHLSAILQQQQLVVCCSPVPLFTLSLTTPSAHCWRHQDHPLIMKWYGRLASWCVACSATDVGSKCNSTILSPYSVNAVHEVCIDACFTPYKGIHFSCKSKIIMLRQYVYIHNNCREPAL